MIGETLQTQTSPLALGKGNTWQRWNLKQFPTFVETDFERIQNVRIGTNDKVLKAIKNYLEVENMF